MLFNLTPFINLIMCNLTQRWKAHAVTLLPSSLGCVGLKSESSVEVRSQYSTSSIHLLSFLFILGLQLVQLLMKRRGTPWRGRQFDAGLTQKNRSTHSHLWAICFQIVGRGQSTRGEPTQTWREHSSQTQDLLALRHHRASMLPYNCPITALRFKSADNLHLNVCFHPFWNNLCPYKTILHILSYLSGLMHYLFTKCKINIVTGCILT